MTQVTAISPPQHLQSIQEKISFQNRQVPRCMVKQGEDVRTYIRPILAAVRPELAACSVFVTHVGDISVD